MSKNKTRSNGLGSVLCVTGTTQTKRVGINMQENVFAVKTKSGCIEQVGKSVITQPKIKFTSGQIKWFDDSQLLKKGESDVK